MNHQTVNSAFLREWTSQCPLVLHFGLGYEPFLVKLNFLFSEWFVIKHYQTKKIKKVVASLYNGAQISHCDLRSGDMRNRQKLWSWRPSHRFSAWPWALECDHLSGRVLGATYWHPSSFTHIRWLLHYILLPCFSRGRSFELTPPYLYR